MGDDKKYMARCLQLAEKGLLSGARPNPMVGAVIVADGKVIGEGYHQRCGEGHAEVNAFASVSSADESLLGNATIYVSLEPCSHYGKTPPCCELILRKGVKRVVVGCVDSFEKVRGNGIRMLRGNGVDVTVGVLEDECRWMNRRFFTFHEKHRPYIILKWAQSADGFLDHKGKACSFSTPLTKMLVHKLRSEEQAILVGRTTFEREHPQLNVRLWNGPSPVKFVLGKCGDVSVHDRDSSAESPIFKEMIDDVLAECRERQLQSLIVEGGRKTLQSFIDAELWDEMRIETAPLVSGEGTKAPQLPADIHIAKTEKYGENEITYINKTT